MAYNNVYPIKVPVLSDDKSLNVNWSPRILFSNTQDVSTIIFGMDASFINAEITKWNTLSTTSSHDILSANTYSLLFDSGKSYIDTSINSANTLYKTFYKDDILQNLKDNSFIVTCDMYLTPLDIKELDFSDIIFISDKGIGDGYYRLNNIKYKKDGLSTVELIKVNYFYLDTSNYINNTYLTKTSTTSLSSGSSSGGGGGTTPSVDLTNYTTFDYVDGSLIYLKSLITSGANSADASVVALRATNVTQDASITAIRAIDVIQDSSIISLRGWNTDIDASIVGLRTYVDGSLSLKVNKVGDTMTGPLYVDEGGGFRIKYSGNRIDFNRAGANYIWCTSVGGYFLFGVNGDSAASPADVASMVITTAKRVGLSNPSPSYTLDVSGYINATQDVLVNGRGLRTWDIALDASVVTLRATNVTQDASIARIDGSLNNVTTITTLGISSYVNTSTYYDASLANRQLKSYINFPAGTVNCSLNKYSTIRLNPIADVSLTTGIPSAGQECNIIIQCSSTSQKTITFSTGFRSSGTLKTGTTLNKAFVLHWVSDGSVLFEISRTGALSV